MIYYRRYIGAYQKRTTRLSMRDHGAYGLMLDFYYAEEQPLPLELEDIYDICKARTPDDRRSVQKVLRLHFERRQDGYHNGRADDEISTSQQARTNGKKGGRPKTDDGTETGTGQQTGNGTDGITESGTEKGGGTVHPSTFNHSAVQPSTDNRPTDSPAEPGADTPRQPPPNRAAAIAVLLRKLEKERGKPTKITSVQPLVVQWAEKGVTDEQLREAHTLAVADREAKGDTTALNAPFLDVFLARIVNPEAQKPSRVNGNGKPWFIDSWSKLVSKGAEKGITEDQFDTSPQFRAAVLEAHGVTPDEVRKAEADYR